MVRVSLAALLAVSYLIVATESVGAGTKAPAVQKPYPAICYPMANKTVVCLPYGGGGVQTLSDPSPTPTPTPTPTPGPDKDH